MPDKPDKKTYSESIEEYMEAILRLSSEGARATVSALARVLNVSQASASAMVRRLADRGLVTAPKYRPVTITDKGSKMAASILRKHRLAERLLTDVLGLPWEQAHDEACRLEHAVSDEVAEKMQAFLDNPDRCPHGNPITASESDDSIALSRVESDQKVTILRIVDEHGDLLRYLATLGLLPGVEVAVKERAPFGGPLLIEVSGAAYALGQEVCDRIHIRPGPHLCRRRRRRRGEKSSL